MTTKRQEQIAKIVAARVCAGSPPKTQNECCALAAWAALRLDPKPHPWPDSYILEMAADLAAGVFGKAFTNGTYAQKVVWIDMAEFEIRKVLARKDKGR